MSAPSPNIMSLEVCVLPVSERRRVETTREIMRIDLCMQAATDATKFSSAQSGLHLVEQE